MLINENKIIEQLIHYKKLISTNSLSLKLKYISKVVNLSSIKFENRLTKIHQRSSRSHGGIIDYIPATFLLEKSRSSSAQVSYTSLIDVTSKRARRSKVKRELENVTLSCQEQRRLPRGSRQPS